MDRLTNPEGRPGDGPEQLIRDLQRLKVQTGSLACLGCGYERGCSVHGCAIIRAAVEEIEILREQVPRWIPVAEKIPPDQEEVLVLTRSRNGVRNVDKGYWAIDHFIHRGRSEVTHWMPLPGLPEEGKRNWLERMISDA